MARNAAETVFADDTVRVAEVTERFLPFSCLFAIVRLTPGTIGKDGAKMMKNGKRDLMTGLGLLLAFVGWTVLIRCADVQPLGPNGTCIGLAAVNGWFHRLPGVHMGPYEITA